MANDIADLIQAIQQLTAKIDMLGSIMADANASLNAIARNTDQISDDVKRELQKLQRAVKDRK